MEHSRAVLCYYYSDPRSKIPVREISHRNDPKGDPNVETKTYGLFTPCHLKMRAKIVKDGIPLLFFCTRRASGVRILTGYYQIGFYCPLPNTNGDFALAAKVARLVNPGFPLAELRPYLRGYEIDKWFRGSKSVDSVTANLLLQLLNDTPDATHDYVVEIHRLERISKKRDGYLYRGKYPRGFSWKAARRLLIGS